MNPASPQLSRNALLALPDETLMAACEIQTFRGPGPGGQKRNKTSSGVRLVHRPTGITAVATNSRSQRRNLRDALRSVRCRIAMDMREEPDGEPFVNVAGGDETYFAHVARVFDALSTSGWSIRDAAVRLNSSTAQVARFLTGDHEVLTEVNRHRQTRGLKPLSPKS